MKQNFKIIGLMIMSVLVLGNKSWGVGCKWGSFKGDQYQISNITYNGAYYPYITFKNITDHTKTSEYSLFKNWGVNTYYGKAMLSIALSAQMSGAKVGFCLSGSDVSALYVNSN